MEVKKMSNMLFCPVCGQQTYDRYVDTSRKCKCGCWFRVSAGWKKDPPKKESGFKETH